MDRDKLYLQVDIDAVWKTVAEDLQLLLEKFEEK